MAGTASDNSAEDGELRADMRRHSRLQTDFAAKLFPGPLDCVVVDFSAGGAGVVMSTAETPPDELVLVLWASGRAFEAQSVWWRGNRVGLRFLRSCDLRDRVPSNFVEAQTVWKAAEVA